MEWRGGYDARENMSYAWYEEDYEDYQGSYHDQDYSYQAQAYHQELSYQEHEFQPWDSTYQPYDATSNQPSQDFDILAMAQMCMECIEKGQREMKENFKNILSQLDQVASAVKVLKSQWAEVESFSKVQNDPKTSDILEGEMDEELQVEDSLEVAIVDEIGEHELLREDTNRVESMLDEGDEMVVEDCLKQEVTDLPKEEESNMESHEGSAHDKSWSELKAPKLELKPLPKGLRYAFLEPNSTYPVIVNDVSDDEVKWLLVELSAYRNAISFSLNDTQSISHSFCLHQTHLEKESRTFIVLQGGLNPKLPNAYTREEYFSLPFIDKTLERLGNHALFCSLLGVLLPIMCRLSWWLTLLLLELLVMTKLKLFPG